MNKIVILLILTLFINHSFGQKNLDFEEWTDSEVFYLRANSWTISSQETREGFNLEKDPTTKYSGTYSIRLNGNETVKQNTIILSQQFQAIYEGRTLTFEYFCRGDVKGVRSHVFFLDRSGGVINTRVLEEKTVPDPIQGWQHKYLTVAIPANASSIIIALYKTGSQDVWFDKTSVSFDGIDVSKAPLIKTYPADEDIADRSYELQDLNGMDKSKVEDMYWLGKIWGFLKYYHPQVGGGKYNWDNKLFEIIPKYISAKNKTEKNLVLETWIRELGPIETCADCGDAILADAEIRPGLDWLKNSATFSKGVMDLLALIKTNRYHGNDHYYMEHKYFLQKHEREYPTDFPNNMLRLLCLYNYWNIIEYWYPYKDRTLKWDEVLANFIPRIINAKNATDFHLAVAELTATIKDSHTSINSPTLNNYFGMNAIPLTVRLIGTDLVVAQDNNGFKAGDLIKKIDGEDIQKKINRITPFTSASTGLSLKWKIRFNLLRTNGNQPVQIVYQRGKVTDSQTVVPQPAYTAQKNINAHLYTYQRDSSYFKVHNRIGYINLENYADSMLPAIREKFADTQGLILDARLYPTRNATFSSFFDSFILPKSEVTALFTVAEIKYPGTFKFLEPSEGFVALKDSSKLYRGKIIVLIDESTLSKGEYFAMRLKLNPNAIFVGRNTAGADGANSYIKLPGNISSSFTSQGVYYPDKSPTQRIGVKPDIEVFETIKDITEKQDALLMKAIDILTNSRR
ncbi:S41 family peptidase [Niabella pedocola]|uniref:S41 family peptidase n=1 Tax=Niabella pedocola TaxID=1752077 RepID=A0ABS8PTM6_9BACT|nr:S41 family peptidase [Niabella pedocola]MCD2424423.1 S41 family peptidase [Niabella pedocola]